MREEEGEERMSSTPSPHTNMMQNVTATMLAETTAAPMITMTKRAEAPPEDAAGPWMMISPVMLTSRTKMRM